MVARAKASRVGAFLIRTAALAAASLLSISPAVPQTPLTLEQASARKGADYAPAWAGEVVLVRGTVASAAVSLLYYDHLSIQDDSGRGLVIETIPGRLASLRAGDVVEVRGAIANRAGMPVVLVSDFKVTGHATPPAPRRVSPTDLNSFRYLGSVVAADGRVIGKGENTGGEYLFIGDRRRPLQVFLPRKGSGDSGMARFEKGDKVRAVGISSQYCPSPPYNLHFQLLVADPADLVLVVKRWPVSPEFFFTVLVALGSVLGAWWVRERRLAAQRATAMALATLGEDVIGAESPDEALRRITRVLPRALKVSHVVLYLYDRASRVLSPVDASGGTTAPVPLQLQEGALPAAPAACFRNRALLAIPRTRRSPFHAYRKAGAPRSVLLVPMCAQSELLGVLEIGETQRARTFTPDEQVAAQHLANQVAISIKLMEQESMRQRLHRTERLAAAGQLITGVAEEVRTPLERILEIAGPQDDAAAPEARLHAVRLEARRAAEILDRVVAFARSEPGEEKTVDLNALLRNVAGFRMVHWETRGIAFDDRLGASPLWIIADPGQLERAFLDLLLDAERALADAPGRRLAIGTSVLAGRAVVEFEYGSAEPVRTPAEASQEWVFRHVIRTCGGELRVTAAGETAYRMELELPLAGQSVSEKPKPAEWAFTVLVVDPAESDRCDLMDLLTARGCRVIPVDGAEQAIDMAGRLRFDVIFCSIHLPGLSWVEFLERVRGHAGAFVLVTEAVGSSPSGSQERDSLELKKPFRAADLDRILARVDARQPYPEHTAAQ